MYYMNVAVFLQYAKPSIPSIQEAKSKQRFNLPLPDARGRILDSLVHDLKLNRLCNILSIKQFDNVWIVHADSFVMSQHILIQLPLNNTKKVLLKGDNFQYDIVLLNLTVI